MASLKERPFAPPPSLVSNLREALKERAAAEHSDSNDADDNMKVASHPPEETDERPCVLVSSEGGIHSDGLTALVRSLVKDGCCKVYICVSQNVNAEVVPSTAKQKTFEVCHVDFEGATAFEVSGSIADCVSLGLSGVLFPKKPSLVICGISLGSNCGFHTFSSAVVAGARQALMCGIPSMALSLEWKDTESYEDDLVAAAHFCLPLIRTALTDSQTNRVLDGLFLNINMPTPFSHNKGFRITQQGSSRPKIKWQVLPSQKSPFGVGLCKQTAIGVRVAQLGLAASAAGAARRANSSSKCIEVESIAGPPNGSEGAIHKKKHHFRMEVTEMVGDGDKTSEFEALRDGFVSVTPLGPRNESDPDVLRRLTEWMGSFVQLDTSLPL